MKKRLLSCTLITGMLVTSLQFVQITPFDNTMKVMAATAGTSTNETNVTKTSLSDSIGTTSIDIPATGEIVVTGTTNQPATEELKQMIEKVKSKIDIPKELSIFDYYFNSDGGNAIPFWYLNWSSKDYNKHITVQIDQKGNIVSFDSYNNAENSSAPKYLKEELKQTADKFLEKVAPKIYNNSKYTESSYVGFYSGQYIYQYQRMENGIPMPDNSVTIGVNYETGIVVSYNSNWLFDVKVPSSEVKISKSEATDIIGKSVTMKLGYQNRYTTDKDGKTTIKAFLVYYPDQSYLSVDAKTGEVYTRQEEWVGDKGAGTNESTMVKDQALTQEEILKAEELSGLISKEAAIKAITGNKSLLLDKNLKSISARLYKRSGNYFYSTSEKDIYVWDVYLSDPRTINYETGDTYRAYASASVDAKTGKILSFNASVKDYYSMNKNEWDTVKVNYTSKQGQSILEKFIKSQIPDLFKNTKLTDNQGAYILGFKNEQEVYGGYSYNFDRVNEDVVYPYNGIYGSVDGVSGKIYAFSYNWDENITFESPKNIITPKAAFNAYISNEGFHLVYETNTIYTYDTGAATKADYYKIAEINKTYTNNSEIRLVYRTDIYPGYISPFTGKQLDFEGNEYDGTKIKYTYSDISGIPSERNIKLLADLGVGYSGGIFLPDHVITKEELINFLNVMGFYYDTTKYSLEGSGDYINRIDAAKFMIQILGYDNVATLKGIYQADFKDKDQIPEAKIGYAAIAHGFNLLGTDGNNNLLPYEKLSRAEAADMLIALLFAR